jgi:hypothetical protein
MSEPPENGSSHPHLRQFDDSSLTSTMDPRAEFHRLFLKNTTLARAAHHYGLTAEEMGLALHYARLSKVLNKASGGKAFTVAPPPPIKVKVTPPDHVWCSQCERRVHLNEAKVCASMFCKARAAA